MNIIDYQLLALLCSTFVVAVIEIVTENHCKLLSSNSNNYLFIAHRFN